MTNKPNTTREYLQKEIGILESWLEVYAGANKETNARMVGKLDLLKDALALHHILEDVGKIETPETKLPGGALTQVAPGNAEASGQQLMLDQINTIISKHLGEEG